MSQPQVAKVTDKINKFMDKDTMGGKIIQVLLGLIIVYIIYIIACKMINTDKLSGANPFDMNAKVEVPIIQGYADSSQIANTTFNTVIPFANNARSLNPSANINGGAQFTYTLWMNIGSSTAFAPNMPIFLRGDANKYSYNVTDTMTHVNNAPTDYVAMCPMLQFGTNLWDFVVRFNTVDNMQEQMYVSNIQSDNDLYRKNLMSLYQGKWFMLTIVFEDNMPINDFANGLIVKFYINELLYMTQTYTTMLRQNNGNMFLFPSGPVSQVMISNFTYFNYALGTDQIQAIYMKGPSSASTSTVANSFVSPMMLADKNKLDIYNA